MLYVHILHFGHLEMGYMHDHVNGFARATEIPISFVIWFSWKFRSWMVLFGSLLYQSVDSFARAYATLCSFNIRIRCRMIHWLVIKDFNQQMQWIRDILLVFDLYESKIKIYDGVDGVICVKLEFWNSLLELGCFAGSIVHSTILLFFRCFFWRSGLLECWIRSYVWSHWFGCSLRPGTP